MEGGEEMESAVVEQRRISEVRREAILALTMQQRLVLVAELCRQAEALPQRRADR